MSGRDRTRASYRLRELVDADAARRSALATAARIVASLRESSRDPRLERLEALLAEAGGGGGDALATILRELTDLEAKRPRAAAAGILEEMIASGQQDLEGLGQQLLDGAIAETGAERGVVLLCDPRSTEARILCARNYETRNLSLEEYRPSRSVVRDVLESGAARILTDASSATEYSRAESVRELALRSVVAAPLRSEGTVIGAIYLDHSAPGRFDEADRQIVDSLGRWTAFLLRQSRHLPSPPGEPVFLDASRASREIVGRSPAMLEVMRLVRRVAEGPATVLIRGESGTGKDLVARALHYEGSRRDAPFVAINCAAIPEALFESELFGHEKGAFTGADRRYVGVLEQADGGTVFFDEIGDMPRELQAKLLRFLQSREIHRLGGSGGRRIEVRVVAATSRDPLGLVREGRFLEALYYRLNVVPLHLPPLRERPGDLDLLVDHFLAKFGALYGRMVRLTTEGRALLAAHDFPGNVRELENLIHRLVALADQETVGPADLPTELAGRPGVPFSLGRGLEDGSGHPATLGELYRYRESALEALSSAERHLAERAVEAAGGNVTRAAEALGVHRTTLHRMLRRGR